jgi:D-beta-D-heptose 7-phosphate kinase/D-beta-D-heptose 1-phosphate adenosyltransferase
MYKLPDFSLKKLMIIGDVMLDSYWYGEVNRISPEAPVPILKAQHETFRIGGAGNVALNTKLLGSKTFLLSLVGDDSNADRLNNMLIESNVNCILHRIKGKRTINKLRVVSQNHQLLRIDFEDYFSKDDSIDLFELYKKYLDEIDVVICSDYAKGVLSNPQQIINAAKAAGKPIVIDPKGKDFNKYLGATILTPNISEFEEIVGKCNSDEEIEEKGTNLLNNLKIEALLITRGERGMTLLSNNDKPLHLPAKAKEIFDVTGAGDTVVALLGLCIACGLSFIESVQISNIAASIVVSKHGTATVSPNELSKALADDQL